MILSSHIIVASAAAAAASAAQASGFKSPLAVFAVALASHYLLDLIPHWEYQLLSVGGFEDKKNDFSEIRMIFNEQNLLKDFLKVSFDFFAGLALAWFLTGIFWPEFSFLFLALAAGASVLPDVLQGFYIASKGALKKIFLPLFIFHLFFHSEIRLKKHPLAGFLFQIFIVGFIVALFSYDKF